MADWTQPEQNQPEASFQARQRRFGDYVLGQQLGSGGMGIVYEAQQTSLNRRVAIKLIRDSQVASPTLLRRFTIEAEAAARLDHPNIVAIHEIGESDGQPYFSMALIEGEGLKARIAAGEFAIKAEAGLRSNCRSRQVVIARLMEKTARAVHHAHQRGVLHRDLKPANILIDQNGEPHLTDFGLAKILRQTNDKSTSQHLTAVGDVAGTPSYMSPEQAFSFETTSASDIYGLGAVMYELLTGRPPFRGNSPLETLQQVRQQQPRRPRAVNRLIQKDLDTICLKCLEKDPHRRYSSAEALAEDLERWIEQQPIKARPAGVWRLTSRWIERNPIGTALIATLFIGLTAALVLLNMVSHQKNEIASRQAELFDEIIGRINEAWSDPQQKGVTVPSRYLAILDGRSRAADSGWQGITLGISINEDPIAFAQVRTRLMGILERGMTEQLGQPVLLHLKIFKVNNREPELLEQGESDFMLLDPLSYVAARKKVPGIIPIVRENADHRGTIVTRAGAGVTRLQDLRGKAFAFPAADDPLTIWAKARLVDAGILKKDLAFCTNFSNQIEYSSAPNPLRVARRVSRRDTIAGILDGRFHAGVTSYERYTIENHRGLMQVDSYSSSPDILAARQGLPAKTVQAFRNSLNAVKANDWQSQAAMKDAFDHEEPVTGVVAIDDSYFNALREALRKARRFDGEPGSPP